MQQTLKRWLKSLWVREKAKSSPSGTAAAAHIESNTSWIAEIDGSAEDWIQRERSRQNLLYGEVDKTTAQLLKSRFPRRYDQCLAAADRAIQHRFHFLGSGEFHSIDPERESCGQGYQPIDWHSDPVRQLRFPTDIHHKSWQLYEMRPGLADVKYPWELARCQHFASLLQAYQLSAKDCYAQEVIAQIRDFMESNPIGYGVNWTCTMDVGIRAANWALALRGIRHCKSLTTEDWQFAYNACFEHGIFIHGNLENHYEVTSNHFLSNVLGLHFLGRLLESLPSGRAWQQFARETAVIEIDKQIYPDGADFESSVPYHRLVTELFLASARLAELEQQPYPDHYYDMLRKMVGLLAAVELPNGCMPVIGDADDGRLHIFSDHDRWQRNNAQHIYGPASLMLDHPEWLNRGGQLAQWETHWWGYSPTSDTAEQTTAKPNAARAHFPDIGLTVCKEKQHYLLISNGVVGTEGFGNHKHNELLSFELHLAGQALIIDAGSGVYTCDPDMRNRYRSTAIHNTLCIDETEQNEINPEWLFRMFETSQAQHLAVDLGDENSPLRYAGRHHGYQRLPQPVRHERAFHFDPSKQQLFWLDRLEGCGEHQLHWHLHIAPGIQIKEEGKDSLLLLSNKNEYRLNFPAGLQLEVVDSKWSPSYGVEESCQAIDFRGKQVVDHAASFEFSIQLAADSAPIPPAFNSWFQQARARVSPIEGAIKAVR